MAGNLENCWGLEFRSGKRGYRTRSQALQQASSGRLKLERREIPLRHSSHPRDELYDSACFQRGVYHASWFWVNGLNKCPYLFLSLTRALSLACSELVEMASVIPLMAPISHSFTLYHLLIFSVSYCFIPFHTVSHHFTFHFTIIYSFHFHFTCISHWFTRISQPFHNRFIFISQSFHTHFTFISLCFTVISQAFHSHFTVISQSFHNFIS